MKENSHASAMAFSRRDAPENSLSCLCVTNTTCTGEAASPASQQLLSSTSEIEVPRVMVEKMSLEQLQQSISGFEVDK